MSWLILTLLAFFGFGFTNLMFKVGERLNANIAVVTVILYTLAAVLSAVWFLSQKQLSLDLFQPKPIIIGSLAAVFSIVGVISVQQAFRLGPASLISPAIGLNALIVITASLFLFREIISPKQLLGIALALIAIYLITSK